MKRRRWPRTCTWCACELPWWLAWRSWCPACAFRAGSCGIYLQAGGPPCRQGAWAGRPWSQRRTTDR